ncbi:MAG: 50S ribosomal protein L21 [Candidatus Blackburnbacteria bacterium RIFCSPHIGHO2_01_FULL_43_15b]|uniref:Large ribosomal subunit protein bL21 n=1 Tax=Candidatus Blackburnbacteria bacterium RIFCSPHIGHO2_01_FULL_43_15b TaxID=1797513 RepID=A0A1G1V2S2_9BACT|nr:MAG: 50S ribosomal protein L21 [Candidatus Blackburnbacteria bacterium RIFCSPHIGHO2_01_FULL_43_15b]
MQRYAVIQAGGHQYQVNEGDELLLDKLSAGVGEAIEFDHVVLVSNDGEVSLGNPFVIGAKVKAQVLGEEKGEKIRVAKYKAKSRYRKVNGFRAQLTRVKVENIVL